MNSQSPRLSCCHALQGRLSCGPSVQVAQFWVKAEHVVAFKQQSLAESRKKEALDKHLTFLVGQTQRYSSLLAQRLTSPAGLAEEGQASVLGGPAGASTLIPGPGPGPRNGVSNSSHRPGYGPSPPLADEERPLGRVSEDGMDVTNLLAGPLVSAASASDMGEADGSMRQGSGAVRASTCF